MARWQQFIVDCGRFFDSGWANRAEAFSGTIEGKSKHLDFQT
jgi:hypothetical protein